MTKMKSIFMYLALMTGFLGIVGANTLSYAQTIQYISADDIIIGYGKSALTLKVTFSAPCTSPKIRIGLPADVHYADGLQHISGNLGITYNSTESTLQSPVFDITGTVAAGSVIEFKIDRQAECSAAQGSNFDSVYVTGSSCNVSLTNPADPNAKNYNVYAPVFSITPPSAINNAVLGTTANRNITISNGSISSATDTIRMFIVYPNGVVNNNNDKITVNSIDFLPSSTNGDTLFYKIFGNTIFGGNHLFENGESINIQEPIKVSECITTNAPTIYGASFGRHETAMCSWVQGNSIVTMASGVPNITSIGGELVNYTNLCSSFDFTITMKNTGTGNVNAATMYDLKVLHGHEDNNAVAGPFDLDTNLLMFSDVRINNLSVPFSWMPGTTIMEIDLNDSFTSDPDGPGVGLDDLDGDGFYDDLPPGATLTLTIKATPKNLPCSYDRIFYSNDVKLFYKDMCGSSKNSDGLSKQVINIVQKNMSGIAYVPANVQGGVPFQFIAKYAFTSNSNNLRTANTRYRWKIVLPAGFSVADTPNAKYGTTNVSNWILSGDTVSFTSPSDKLENFYINLVYTCGSGGPKDIQYFLEEINDTSVSPECTTWGNLICATISTEAKCPEPCAAGPTTFKPIIRRADGSLGWTDNTMTTRQSISNISEYDLSKALYMDTIQITGVALQNNTTTNLHLHFDLAKTSGPIGKDKLTPISFNMSVYRAGVLQGAPYSTSTFDTTGSTSSDQVITCDLSAGLPSGGLLPNDSIVTVSKYIVARNGGLSGQDIQSGGNWYFYNLNGATEEYCDSWVPEMYLVGTSSKNNANDFTAKVCDPVVLGGPTWSLARRFNEAGQFYESEFRPAFYIDSIVTDVPTAYELNELSIGLYTVNPSNSSLGSAGSMITLIPDAINGSKYTYINPGNWSIPNITKAHRYGSKVNVKVTPTCATEPVMNTNIKVYIRDFYYAYATGPNTPAPSGLNYVLEQNSKPEDPGSTETGQTQPINYSNPGDLTMQNLTGEIQGVEATHKWTLQLGNSGTNPAPYTWIAIPNNPKITVTEVKDGSTVLSGISYTGGIMYQLDPAGINSGATKNYDIHFTYTTCNTDSLLVLGGWNCGSFPADPTAYICGMDSIYLKIVPEPSVLQLTVDRQPGGGNPADLCQEDSAIIIVNSAAAANLMSPYLTFNAPAGITLPSTLPVEYPLNSNNFQYVPVTLTGNTYSIDLSAHTAIAADGIKGLAAANSTDDRQARVIVKITTDCNYTSGSSFRFRGYANRPCGKIATGSGVAVTTNAFKITGATTTGDVNITLGIGSTPTLNCSNTLTISSTIMPLVEAAQATDTVIYTLADGLTYAENLTPSSLNAVVIGDQVRIAMPSTGANASTNISFDVKAADGYCGSSNVTAEYKRQISGLTCGATTCSSSSLIMKSVTSDSIEIVKPHLTIDNAVLTSDSIFKVGPNSVDVTVSNIGIAAPANTYKVEVFCGSNTTPFDAVVFPAAISANSTVTSNMTFNMPQTGCDSGDLITYRIRLITETNDTQCLCESTSFASNQTLPIKLSHFDVTKSGSSALLTWTTVGEYNNQGFEIERSANGKQFFAIGFVNSQSLNTQKISLSYSYIDHNPLSGINYYRLKQVDMDGQNTYSEVRTVDFDLKQSIKIYPNPTKDMVRIEGLNTPSRIRVYDVTGRLLIDVTSTQTSEVLSLNAFSEGIYRIYIMDSNGSFITKDIVKTK